MKTMMKLLASAVLLAAGTLAFAQTGDEGAANPAKHLKSLGLNDTQITQVTDIWTKTEGFARTQMAQIRVIHAQIDLAMSAPSPDLNAVNALVDKGTQLQADLRKKVLAAEVQVKQIVGDQVFYRLKEGFLARHRMGLMGGHPLMKDRMDREGMAF